MGRAGSERKSLSAPRIPDALPGVLRRALADSQRRTLERLIQKSGTVDINELTRERLERSIRVHEDFAEFLTFAGEHLAGRRGKQRLTASELQVLDLMPRQTFD